MVGVCAGDPSANEETKYRTVHVRYWSSLVLGFLSDFLNSMTDRYSRLSSSLWNLCFSAISCCSTHGSPAALLTLWGLANLLKTYTLVITTNTHTWPRECIVLLMVDVLLLRRVSQTPRLQRLPPMIDGCTVGIEQDVVVVAVRVHADAREIE